MEQSQRVTDLGGWALPEEMTVQVFSFLPPAEFVRMQAVCKDWKRITEDQQVQRACYRDTMPPPLAGKLLHAAIIPPAELRLQARRY